MTAHQAAMFCFECVGLYWDTREIDPVLAEYWMAKAEEFDRLATVLR